MRTFLLILTASTGCAGRTETPVVVPPAAPAVDAPVVGGPSGDPAAGRAACEAIGGACTAISACSADLGHLTDVSCEDHPGMVCCVAPATSCGGTEDFVCCAGTAVMRPTCVGGTALACPASQTRAADAGACPTP